MVHYVLLIKLTGVIAIRSRLCSSVVRLHGLTYDKGADCCNRYLGLSVAMCKMKILEIKK